MNDEIEILNEKLKALEQQRAGVLREIEKQKVQSFKTITFDPDKTFDAVEKIAIFRGLFRGREDIYARRWQNDKGCGYAPVKDFYGNYLRVNDTTVLAHLQGVDANKRDFVMGIYPLLQNGKCWFMAIDFPRMQDAVLYQKVCADTGVPCYIEISRGGGGAHVWMFFSEPVEAREARKMGIILLSFAFAQNPEMGFELYDRLYPSQDTLPRGGAGSLIALPLQQAARKNGATLFVDSDLKPYADQWQFLAQVKKISLRDVNEFLFKYAPMPTESDDEPWLIPPRNDFTDMKLPEKVNVTLSDKVYIERGELPGKVISEILKLAAFKNPEFYRAQAMRFSTHDKPRIITCGEITKDFIIVPRGIFPEVRDFLLSIKIIPIIEDKRYLGEKIDVKFNGTLHEDQAQVVKELTCTDIGILSAPTAFGKTVTAIGAIAARGVSTLILVHRSQLAEQWKERLTQFLPDASLGMIGGGKFKPTGVIDIALIQSLIKREDLKELMSKYGHLVVDECHHVAATSFETVAAAFGGKNVLGLTATLERKDGHQPIIKMQCGPVVADVNQHSVKKDFEKYLIPRYTFFNFMNPMVKPEEVTISDIYTAMCENSQRNLMICSDVTEALKQNRGCIILSERKEHLKFFENYFAGRTDNMIILTGGMTPVARASAIEKMKSVPKNEEMLILATGKFLGEGFDEARLDTLFLTMPISWKGTLAQYAGRLNRDYAGKKDARIYDYIDDKIPMMAKMYKRRLEGYRALGYKETEIPVNGKI